MEILGKLFGSIDRVKIMRLFILNPELTFNVEDVARRSKSLFPIARREINILDRLKFLKPRSLVTVTPVENSQIKAKKRIIGYQLNSAFPYLLHLRNLLKSDLGTKRRDLAKLFQAVGRIKLLIIAGLFIQESDSRADLVLVGDHLKRGLIEKIIKGLEAEIGRELNYAVFDTTDFTYRLTACDKFVRDILDYPHEKLIDRLIKH